MKSVILPTNKSKELDSYAFTAAGERELTVSVEQSAAAFTLHISALVGRIEVKVHHVGTLPEDDKVLVYYSDQLKDVGTHSFELKCEGPMLISICSTGAATYTLRGKAMDSVSESPISLDTAETIAWREHTLTTLQEIRDIAEAMLNHLRAITSIEEDEGDKY